MDGFINLLKPAGMTSHDAVFALRRILRMKKIGHTGTLDPMAAGVLSMCIGNATRAAEYLEADDKTYRCELQLGITTDTGDIWGNCISEADKTDIEKITAEMAKEAVESMKGEQYQLPPLYSAIRKNGKHLYEYARNGETVEIEPRKIIVKDIRPVSIFHEPGRIMFDVDCSKGTYVRSLCTDIGDRLGCGATMSFLVRTRSGSFRLEDAVTIEELTSYVSQTEGIPEEEIISVRRNEPLSSDMSRFVISVDQMLEGFGKIRLNSEEHRKYVNGGKIAARNAVVEMENSLAPDKKFSNLFRVYDESGRFSGTAAFNSESRIYTAGKVFFRW